MNNPAAEKALATLQSRPIHGVQPPVFLVLSPYPPTNPPTPLPPPSALPRLVKHLPVGYSDGQLYDLFRPFGALASVRTQTGFGSDTGVVEFWREEDARVAEGAMHCFEVDGQNIAVTVFQNRRASGGPTEFSAHAPAFVPSGSVYTYPAQYSPPRATPYGARAPLFIHGPGQQVQLAPLSGPGSNSHSGLIDPCNLFCKNLDPEIDSNQLFTHFRQAALTGTLNLPMRYDDLAALSPVVRKEVLTGELSRRIKTNDEVVAGIQDPAKLADQIANARNALKSSKSPSPAKSPSPVASQDSRVLDATALNATASAPEHPSTPISISASISTPPRTSSPSGSVPPISEKDRMAAAVAKLEPSRQAELTELLMSLPKRERAMCLFNVEVLRAKVADAKTVLDCSEGDEERKPEVDVQQTTPVVPVTPQAKKTAPPVVEESPQTPALSSRGPSAASSPTPATPASSTHTLASLARLPAAEIIKVANSPSATGLPLPKPDPLVVKATDEFIDSLLDKPIQAQKQQLGDKLWRAIKSFGIKGAPKLTIALLDQDDLRALAHLMNSYPAVLKEKALLLQAGGK
ncbi:hypothetical protein ID866_10371 [Astraeus odoratus]|nr:hypothetical protein ID866_10371 [Astraeus odoratus]